MFDIMGIIDKRWKLLKWRSLNRTERKDIYETQLELSSWSNARADTLDNITMHSPSTRNQRRFGGIVILYGVYIVE